MPQLSSPRMPEWAERVYAAMGNRPAIAVLAVLIGAAEPMSGREVAAEVGLNAEATSAALQRLEATGLIVGSVPAPRPRGTRATWTVDRAAVDALVRDMDAGLRPHR